MGRLRGDVWGDVLARRRRARAASSLDTGSDRMELGGRSIESSAYDHHRLGLDTCACVGTVDAATANATASALERSRRGAPVIEHPPQHRIGQRDEPAKTSVARRRPVADDEGPQDEEVDVRFD